MKPLLRHFLSLVAVAGFGIALWPAGQTAYAHWSQARLQSDWQSAQSALTRPYGAPSPNSGRGLTTNAVVRDLRDEQLNKKVSLNSAPVPFISEPSPKIGWAPKGDRAVAGGRGEGTLVRLGSRVQPWPPTRIVAPQIDLDAVVVQGDQPWDLRRGPGHDPATVLPGQPGNCIIAGHRNVYGSYLFKLDQIANGSQIALKTPRATYNYYVVSVYTVPDSNLTPYEPTEPGVRQLTILSCTLPHSDERLIVNAQM